MKEKEREINKKVSVLPTSADEIPVIGNGGLRKSILMATLIPLFFLAIVLVIAGSLVYSITFQKQVKEELEDVSSAVLLHYDSVYPGNYNLLTDNSNSKSYLYKGDVNLNENTEYIDVLSQNTDTEISLFFYDMRLLTTLTDASNKSLNGTIANKNLVNAILVEKTDKFFSEALIEGERYCVYYKPFFSDTGTCLGMIGVAKSYEVVNHQIFSLILINGAIMLILLVVLALCIVKYTNSLVGSLKDIREYLSDIAEGNLDTVLNMKVVERQDEIGDMGRLSNFLRTSMKKLVERDPLTNLNNRRSGIVKIKNLRTKAEKNGLKYSVAMCDIDHFKSVNDTYGHDAGDTVLKEVAKHLRDSIYGHGTAIRWGGEEFLILLENVDEAAAKEKLWNILYELREKVIMHEQTPIRVTMSIGVIGGNLGVSYEEEITLADARLYFAKEHGRNQVISSEILDINTDNNADNSDEA